MCMEWEKKVEFGEEVEKVGYKWFEVCSFGDEEHLSSPVFGKQLTRGEWLRARNLYGRHTVAEWGFYAFKSKAGAKRSWLREESKLRLFKVRLREIMAEGYDTRYDYDADKNHRLHQWRAKKMMILEEVKL